MLSAIDFDDEFFRETDKIHDVTPHRVLPAEPVPIELPMPQARPKPYFGVGWGLTQPPGRF